MSIVLRGIPASSGIAVGPIWRYRQVQAAFEEIANCDPVAEWERFGKALDDARQQLLTLEEHTRSEVGEAETEIFDAHRMMLDDPEWHKAIRDVLTQERVSAEAAVQRSAKRFAGALQASDIDYLKDRAQDVLDVGQRLIFCLQGVNPDDVSPPAEPAIILAENLTPSDTVRFGRDLVLGFCTVRGSPASHAAILARSLNVPAVVNVPLHLDRYQDGQLAILDGDAGQCHIDPDRASLAQAEKRSAYRRAKRADLVAMSQRPAVTTDGHRVAVVANIGGLDDASQAIALGAEGVGLLRTEFLYIGRSTMPSRTEQVRAYQRIAKVIGERPIVVRTLDIGGDKAVPYLGLRDEPNPFLGWRAIRMMSDQPDVLQDQVAAMLQGFAGSDLRILLPMVSSLEEVELAREILDAARDSLNQAGKPVAEKVQLGVMVEVPSVALLADHFADYVDFFSIGTNDLTQYTLAVDRTNERVADLASPLHPAVIRLIQRAIEQGHAHGKWVGICGEIAGDPFASSLLLGLGLDEFSMAPASIPKVKERIRQLSYQACRETASHILTLPTTAAVKDFLSALG